MRACRRFSKAAEENGLAHLTAGIHFRHAVRVADVKGAASGRQRPRRCRASVY
jgi:hypothetical protein